MDVKNCHVPHVLNVLLTTSADPIGTRLFVKLVNPQSYSYAPISTTPLLIRGAPVISVVTLAGMESLIPLLIAYEESACLKPSSTVPQILSGPLILAIFEKEGFIP